MTVKRIDHVAIVVHDIDQALSFYRDTLGLAVTHVEQVKDQDVAVAFLSLDGSEIELVKPITETSGVARYLAKHGPGIHHLCLEVDHLEATLAALKARGVQLIDEEPRIGSGGRRIAFIHPHSTYGVLIELYDSIAIVPGSILRSAAIEARALWAGLSAFWRNLSATGPTLREEAMNGNGRGIRLKAEGEIIEE